jgi:hypothetical protein
MDNLIKFIDLSNGENKYPPIPASSSFPDWYKNTKGDLDEASLKLFDKPTTQYIPGSIKKCVPVLDILSAGYLLQSPADLIITQVNNQPYYQWYGDQEVIGFHPNEQAKLHPLTNNEWIPKWSNTWGIKTPKGYSCLFLHPQHRDGLPFITLSGVVDTDSYTVPVELLFSLKNPKYEGFVPAGTPICQVIPFKRESWSSSFGKEPDIEESKVSQWRLRKLKQFNYKHGYWSKKFYK